MTTFRKVEPLQFPRCGLCAWMPSGAPDYIQTEYRQWNYEQALALRDWLSAALGEDKGGRNMTLEDYMRESCLCHDGLCNACEQVRLALERLQACERDAARYRWLRNEKLDAAIDAALAQVEREMGATFEQPSWDGD